MILVAYIGMQLWMSRDTPDGLAPDIKGVTLTGQVFDLQQIDQPVLIHFWATWCTICRIEQGAINDIAQDHNIITIASQSGTRNEVKAIVQERGISAPVIVDSSNQLANLYGVRAFPSSFVVTPEGKIVFREIGLTSEWGIRLRLWWAKLTY